MNIEAENKLRKMIREELLKENVYETELNSIDVSIGIPKIQIHGSGQKTKFIDLNAQSIPVLISWLKKVLKNKD